MATSSQFTSLQRKYLVAHSYVSETPPAPRFQPQKRPRMVDLDDLPAHSNPSRSNGTFTPTPKRHKAARPHGPDPVLLEQRKRLPIWKGSSINPVYDGRHPHVILGRESLVHAVAENDTVVILGETGSGKTTR